VVAWRVFHLTKLGRQTPEVPCTVYFEEDEWKALMAFVTHRPEPPLTPPSLWVAMTLVAMLGGWFGAQAGRPAWGASVMARAAAAG